MLKIDKKFIPKNVLLQSNLEQFLSWRFQKTANFKQGAIVGFHTKETKMKAGVRSFDEKRNSGLVRKSRNSFYQPNFLRTQRGFDEFLANESFFPQKKPFMQFWTLPLLGASFLSFLTFEKQGWSMPTFFVNGKETLILGGSHHDSLTQTLSNTDSYKAEYPVVFSDSARLNTVPLNPNAAFSSKASVKAEQNSQRLTFEQKPLVSKFQTTEKNQVEALCAFYLNLTKERVLEPLNLESSKALNPGSLNKELLLKYLYFNAGKFHWNFYPLYSTEQKKPTFSQKELQNSNFAQKLNPEIFSLFKSPEKTLELTEWKQNPILSYFKSVQFFEDWVKMSEFQLESKKFNGKLQTDKAFDTFLLPLTPSVEQSKKVRYFQNFLKTASEQRSSCVQAYSQLKQKNTLLVNGKTVNFAENRFRQIFSKNFKHKYTISLNTSLQTKLSNILAKSSQFSKKHQLRSTSDAFLEKNKKQGLKHLFYQCVVLKTLDQKTRSNSQTHIKTVGNVGVDLSANSNPGEFASLIEKNKEKFIQESFLYAQLQSIQNKLNTYFQDKTNEKQQENVLTNKALFYFSNLSTKDVSSTLSLRLKNGMEIQTLSNSTKKNSFLPHSSSWTALKNLETGEPSAGNSSVQISESWQIKYKHALRKIQKHFPQFRSNLVAQNALSELSVSNFQKESFKNLHNLGQSGQTFNMKKNVNKYNLEKMKRKKMILQGFAKQSSLKTEKIFRTYLSIKNAKGLENKGKSKNFTLFKNKKEKQKFLFIVQNFKNRMKHSKRKTPILDKRVKTVFLKAKKLNLTLGEKNRKVGLKAYQSSAFLHEFTSFSFLKRTNVDTNSTDFTLFERKKALEKKRRLKKLKLENRRRKKRKRFYPRPHFLRFQLYSNFLNKRHGFVKPHKHNLSENLKPFSQTRPTLNYTSFKRHIYGPRTGSGLSLNSERKTGVVFGDQTLRQKEFYKISNETLTEFERLCWKSYWLRSNLKPYVLKIQKSLKRIKDCENLKNTDQAFSGLISSFSLDISKFPSPNNGLNFQSTQSKNRLKPTPAYLNIRENLKTGMPYGNISSPSVSTSLFYKAAKKAEYEKLLYDRMNDEIKNVKSQLTVEGQNQARSYKPGRQKIEKTVVKPFWNAPFAFRNNYVQPDLNAAYGLKPPPYTRTYFNGLDFPTLRLLWACQKTQLYTFQPNNMAQNLWHTYKKREQRKNNQTRKFLYKMSRKVEDFQDLFEVSNTSPSLRSEAKVLTQTDKLDGDSETGKLDGLQNEIEKQGLQNKKLYKLSLKKTSWANKKVQTFGGFLLSKNYGPYLKTLKFQLQKNPVSKLERLNNEIDKQTHFTKNQPFTPPNTGPWFETNMENFIQKRALHFWWNLAETKTEFPFLLGSPFLFTNPEKSFLDNSEKFPENSRFENYVLSQALWVCASVFHVGIFFALVRIPEIRSLVKFQLLILSKLANAYMLGIFAIYDLLKTYGIKLQHLSKKVLKVSSQDFVNSPQGAFVYNKNVNNLNTFKTPVSFKFHQTKTSEILPLQRTVYWNFSYKLFFKPSAFTFNSLKVTKTGEGLLNQTVISSIYGTGHNFSTQQKIYMSWSTGFFWTLFLKNFNTENFSKQKKILFETFLKQNLDSLTQKSSGMKKQEKKGVDKTGTNKNVSYALQTNIQVQSFLSLIVLTTTRVTLRVFYLCLNVFYKCVFQMIDLLEGTLLIFYKFLEKPAEVVVDWIAEVFLIEWTSDISTYVPEAFDTGVWTSVTKASRSTRFFYGLPLGFGMQRFLLQSGQIFYGWLLKPDADLIARQKKGIIFWDIWSEILIQAAEQYKMNLSSLSTVKEEQELLMENLLERKPVSEQSSGSKFGKISGEGEKRRLFGTSEQMDFLNREAFKQSLNKLDPLMKFIESSPKFSEPVRVSTLSLLPTNGHPSTIFQALRKKQSSSLPFGSLNMGSLPSTTSLNLTRIKFQNSSRNPNFQQSPLNRWAVSQYLNTQGKDTDLFMDIHPPKSFNHVSFLKSYLPAQEILGSLVCEIYSGLFASKVSKNVLIVGAPGMAKSFFIQALAGETELKIVLDNAHRYAFVNGGVPVGMKLLREVFDSIALHTPCLFLLEDVHVIGERRPMLISDDETSKTKETAFGAEQEEVHEKNKLVYQLSKHALSHYKKPYKGDFSLAIPTNHFCYDLFLGVLPPRKRRSDLSAPSPLPVQQLENSLLTGGLVTGTTASGSLSENVGGSSSSEKLGNENFLSSLQIASSQVFAPPATSPFHVLLMKEQKKLKPKKLVKDIPWSGLSYDQWMLLSKNNYSVRVKVALLAETAMKNLSVKLDMITDLLVIIDSVRSNRGFVVFATTHVPALLDPALRRPGRLDETIALPLLPNIQTRFEIFKTRLSSYVESMDFLDWSFYSGQLKQNENELTRYLDKHILLLLNSKKTPASLNSAVTSNLTRNQTPTEWLNPYLSRSPGPRIQAFVFEHFFNDYPIYSLAQSFKSSMQLQSLWLNPTMLKKMVVAYSKPFQSTPRNKMAKTETQSLIFSSTFTNGKANGVSEHSHKPIFAGTDKTNFVALSYAQAGQFLMESLFLKDQTTYTSKLADNVNVEEFSKLDRQKFMYQSLYSSNLETKQTLFRLFAAKLTQFFVFQAFNPALNSTSTGSQAGAKFKNTSTKLNFNSSNSNVSFRDLVTNPSQRSNFNNLYNSVNTWQAATSFLDALFQKRYLYNKNSIVSKMLFFEDNVSLNEAPSPPSSSILMPARRFENYKRTLRDFIQKPGLNINQKLQMHQKQRFLKLLYNIPLQDSFAASSRSEAAGVMETGRMKGEKQSFYNSFKELGYLDFLTLRPSSAYGFYQKVFLNRQRFSFLNQWWNGQLAEHNAETTYLSHIDWRSIFVPELGDVFLDFPDAEQYYNPRQRRWFLHSKAWSYWLNFEADLRQEISHHFMMECFAKTSELLNSNREVLDSLSYAFLRNHQLHELDLLQVLVRFYKQSELD